LSQRRLGFSLGEITEYRALPIEADERRAISGRLTERGSTELRRMRGKIDETVRELENIKQDALARLKESERPTVA
jgi:DNA-binding PadR family transcriptional regulator